MDCFGLSIFQLPLFYMVLPDSPADKYTFPKDVDVVHQLTLISTKDVSPFNIKRIDDIIKKYLDKFEEIHSDFLDGFLETDIGKISMSFNSSIDIFPEKYIDPDLKQHFTVDQLNEKVLYSYSKLKKQLSTLQPDIKKFLVNKIKERFTNLIKHKFEAIKFLHSHIKEYGLENRGHFTVLITDWLIDYSALFVDAYAMEWHEC